MTTTYTTAEIVQNRVSQVSGSLLSIAEIENNINMAEGIIDGVLQATGVGSADFTFDATKHGLVRDTATNLAAFMSLSYDVDRFVSNQQVSLVADMLFEAAARNLKLLSTSNVKKHILGV